MLVRSARQTSSLAASFAGALAGLVLSSCSGGGGGSAPMAATVTTSPAATASPTVTSAPIASATPSPISTAVPTPSPTLSPTPSPTPSPSPTPAGFTVTGPAAAARYANLDATIETFMQRYGIRAGQLAVGTGGTVVFSHGYTNSTDSTYAITQPTSIMRISSNAKAFETAALSVLYAQGKLTPSTLVWPLLGVTKPLLSSQSVDPRTSSITVQELYDHTAGYHDSSSQDPAFQMYGIAQAAGDTGPLSKDQFTAYLYGVTLGNDPGAREVYSNDGYYLLARVIEKAAGTTYLQFVDANVLAPIGISDDVVTATAQSGRRANETTCDDPANGPSVLLPQQNAIVPDCYGGITVYEVLDGPSSISISAQSLAIFAGHNNVYGLGARRAGYAREGSFVGSVSWMESLGDGYDFAFSFNSRVDANGNIFDISPLTSYLEHNL